MRAAWEGIFYALLPKRDVEIIFDQGQCAACEHLHADQANEHSSESLHRDEPFFSQELLDVGAEQDDDEGGDPGGDHGRADQKRRSSFMSVEHDGGDGAGPCNDGDGQRDDHRLAGQVLGTAAVFRKDHAQRDEEEKRASRDPDDGTGNPDDAQSRIAKESEEEQDGECNAELSANDLHLLFLIEAGEHSQKEGDLARSVEDEEDRRGDGEEGGVLRSGHIQDIYICNQI